MNRKLKKMVQTINYFAYNMPNNSINRMKMLKLLWIADKFHLLKYGRTIIEDNYFALKNGPIQSEVKNISSQIISGEYINDYISSSGHNVDSIKEPELNYFSKSDLEVLNLVIETFGDKNQWELMSITHEYPEWKKFEEKLNQPDNPKKRYPMDIEDFFSPLPETEISYSEFFKKIHPDIISDSKNIYKARKNFQSI